MSGKNVYPPGYEYSLILDEVEEFDDEDKAVVKGRIATQEYMEERAVKENTRKEHVRKEHTRKDHTKKEHSRKEQISTDLDLYRSDIFSPSPRERNISDVSDVPIESIRFFVKRGPTRSTTEYWAAEFPRILEGLVDKREYNRIVTKINSITREVCKKSYYSNGFLGTMWVTGSMFLIPIIPAVVLSVRKLKKIERGISSYLEDINAHSNARGYKWGMQKDETQSGRVGSVYIEFFTDERMAPQQKFWIAAHSSQAFSRYHAGPIIF